MASAFPICLLLIAILLGGVPVSAQSPPLTPEEEKKADLRLPALDRSALEPGDRIYTEVPLEERNPFGVLSVPEPEELDQVQIKVESEEDKIKRVLTNMKVGGLSGGPGTYRVLLGPMALTKGDRLPQIFHNQREQLVVDEITDGKITLRFVEAGSRAPRMFDISFIRGLSMINEDGSHRARALMPGDLYTSVVKFDETGQIAMQQIPTLAAQGLMDAFSNEQLTEALYDGRRQLLGEIWPARKDETAPEQPTR
jgi:hypothetical protein